MEIYISIYDMFRKREVKMEIGRAPKSEGRHRSRWGAVRHRHKKSPDVETPGLRYLDLISVVD
jgi:hypothetical protein